MDVERISANALIIDMGYETIITKEIDKIVSNNIEYLIIKGEYVTAIGDGVLFSKKIKTIQLPDTISIIGHNFLGRNKHLEKFKIPESTFLIHNEFLFECYSLKEIEFNNNLTTIKDAFLYDALNIEYITLPPPLKNIGNGFMVNNLRLKEVILPHTLESVGNYFLTGCENLEKVVGPPLFMKKCFLEGCHSLNDSSYPIPTNPNIF
jgi:hypothetical protein